MSTDANTATRQTKADHGLAPASAHSPDKKPNGAAPGAQAAAEMVSSLTVDSLRDVFQSAGYRVETVRDGNVTFLRSATNGLGFDIRPGNRFPATPDRFADIAIVGLFAIRGTLPLDLLNRWNRTHRFGRLFLDTAAPGQEFLVFCVDVSVAGGVTPAQLRRQIEIWDGLVQQLVPWLREEIGKIAPTIDTTSAAPATAQQAASASDESAASSDAASG
jgi:hypothetical protein